jgi:predicted nucleic acid-binding protein
MRIVDTSTWIEWLIASPTGTAVASAIPPQTEWIVPTMVQLELAKWLTREVGEDQADQVISFTQVCHVVPLDTRIALAAAEICREHKLATADAIIYATTLDRNADVLTCDARFEGLPAVTFIRKVRG